MSLLSPTAVTKYTAILKAAINVISEQQANTNNEVPLSNNLLDALTALGKLMAKPIEQKNWFAEYHRIFTTYFFDARLKSYIDLFSSSYNSIWLALGITEKIEVAQIAPTLYNFPNLTVLTSENFESKVKKAYQDSVQTVASTNGFDLNFYKEYKLSLHINEYILSVVGKEEAKNLIYVWVYPSFIKVETKNDGIPDSIANLFVKALFHTMFM